MTGAILLFPQYVFVAWGLNTGATLLFFIASATTFFCIFSGNELVLIYIILVQEKSGVSG
jgi:hypothetical protein